MSTARGPLAFDVSVLMDFEDGLLTEEEEIDLIASLVKSGLVWSLQGSYGRMAQALIDSGEISSTGDRLA